MRKINQLTKSLTVLICLLQITVVCCRAQGGTAPIYHVDQNQVHPMIPGYARDIAGLDLSHHVAIHNGYQQTVRFLSSIDRLKWDTIKLEGKFYKFYNNAKIFIKISNSSGQSDTYEASAGGIYSLFYDKDKKKWLLK